LHPTSGLWRRVPRYEDRPKLAERGEPECCLLRPGARHFEFRRNAHPMRVS
jgi:hypothetical protein